MTLGPQRRRNLQASGKGQRSRPMAQYSRGTVRFSKVRRAVTSVAAGKRCISRPLSAAVPQSAGHSHPHCPPSGDRGRVSTAQADHRPEMTAANNASLKLGCLTEVSHGAESDLLPIVDDLGRNARLGGQYGPRCLALASRWDETFRSWSVTGIELSGSSRLLPARRVVVTGVAGGATNLNRSECSGCGY